MNWLQTLFDNSNYTLLSAFLLGLMTAISPCPLAMNITAIGFISKDIKNKKTVFYKGLIYTLGRAFSYTILGIIIFISAGQIKLRPVFEGWGEKVIGPMLILIGVLMLDLIKFNIPGFGKLREGMEDKAGKGYWNAFLLGVVFALAFCPYSGVLYFMILIPMTIASISGLYLPVIFAVGTGLPVILFAFILAYTVGSLGRFYNAIRKFEFWFRRIVAVLFILTGIYYILIVRFGI
jgi:cytochrome c-type biogenesis protein